ncbi:helix-turn-helix domain-containing protein [Buttiauxella selenatireducens]|uniref:Helix-turn-helix domain-containing protein n=1 Tax=Buttiauxella selenatireducens TaxID=3073902 RepID=A0ABY9SBQ0_9ENTR|nr:helix-turn-helix domain-containing protein [Buttiauxella sp. R73]WMY73567.1 helix-turn-helix domain-containing protein [Buttiauxella sp. R73]
MFTNMLVVSELVQEAHEKIGLQIDSSPHKLRIISSKKQEISFYNNKEKSVFHLISGEIELRSTNSNLIVLNVYAPAIIGLSSIFTSNDLFYINTVTDVELVSIPMSELVKTANEKNLWMYISTIMSHYLDVCYLRDSILYQDSVYNVIKNHLEILWRFKRDKLDEISVFDFILNRTPVSRSSLNKVLKDLVSGGYIKMNRGKLVEMNKLPSGY